MTDNTNIDSYVSYQNSQRGQAAAGTDSVGINPGENSVVGWGNAILPGGHDNTVLLDGIHGAGGYKLNVASDGTTTITDTGGQTMTVSGAEYLIFNGGSAATPGIYDSMVIIANGPDADLARLYQVSFGRLPDLPGYEAWKHQLDSGSLSLTQIAQSFIAAPEFQAKIPPTLGDQDFVSALYTNVLGRAADKSGLQAWTGYLTSLEAQGLSPANARATVLLGFVNSAEEHTHSAGWLADTSQGGYADPGMPLDPKTALNAAASSKIISTGLLAPTTGTLQSSDFIQYGNAGFQITSSASATKLYASASGASIIVTSPQTVDANGLNTASGYVTRVVAEGNNTNVQLSGNGDQVYIYGNNSVVTLTHHSSQDNFFIYEGNAFNIGNLQPGFDSLFMPTNMVITGFNKNSDFLNTPLILADRLLAPGQTNQGHITVINAAFGPVNGAGLDFAHSIYAIDLGDVGDGTATSVATAAQAGYTPGGQRGITPTSQTVFDPTKIIPGENITFIGHVTKTTGFATSGDQVWYSWGQFQNGSVLISPANGGAQQTQGFYGLTGNPDVNGNHLVDAGELSFSAHLVGIDKISPVVS